MGVESNPIVALLGTGGGYGEAIVLRVYEHYWIVVDSCENPQTGENLPIGYLLSKGVDVANDVKYVVCTHWHSDHIRGLDRLIESCRSADMICAIPSDKEKFMTYIMQEATKSSQSSTDIFNNCVTLINNRNSKIKIAHPDRTLYNDNNQNIWMASLSPSDEVLRNFLLEQYVPNIKSIYTPNDKCIVLLMNFNNHFVLLGGDLECSGWMAIMNDSQLINDGLVEVFKVPHHGSDNGYVDDFWVQHVSTDVITHLSAYNRGSQKLPTAEMLKLYTEKSKEIYMTSVSTVDKAKMKERNLTIKKVIKDVNKSVTEIPYQYGLVESELCMDEEPAIWHTKLYGSAVQIEKER